MAGRPQPTLAAVRRFRLVALGLTAAVAGVLGVGVAAAGPYDGEIAAHEEAIAGQLELIASARRELVTAENRIAEAEALIASRDDELAVLPVQLELLADEFVDILVTRDEPAALRHQMAIDAYVRNDERLNAVLNQSAQLAERALEDVRHRMLYEAVIEVSMDRLEVVDARLRLAADQVDGLRVLVAEAEDRQREAMDALAAVRESMPDVESRITEARAEIRRLEEEIQRLEVMSITTRWTGKVGTDVQRPVLAVKIDNVSRAHPQSGVNAADVVYEELVEAGISRLVAVFQSTDAPVVGPVRSARTSDPPLLEGFDRPLFAYSGANRGTQEAVDASTLLDVGHDAEPDLYWRSEDRRAPHNLFTSADALWALALDRREVPPEPFTFRFEGQDLHPAAEPAAGVFVDFGRTEVDYEWNGSGWQRTHNGEPHVDSDGTRVAPPNVVIMFTEYGTSAADARSPEAVTTGSGQAWVLTDGHVVRGEWRRTSADLPARLTAGGEPVHLTPGRTWVALAPADSATLR